MRQVKSVSIQDFEQNARELTRIIYALTDQRYQAAPQKKSPVARALSEAVLNLQAAMITFRHIYHLPDPKETDD